ncbi:hypothetical protein [Actinoplanes sp. NPDC049118]|uniref:alpha-amylase family glycosyl hydrolase n=1 Tax=Actinoplanes sp. NPDC049118 TaxID=3155769 RepID=UPI0033DBAE3E
MPCLYYGDEIGMRYVPGMPNVEGAVCNPAYNRAGCRTPMQWDAGPNAGFSYARGESHLVVVNPRREPATLAAPEAVGATALLTSGVSGTADGLVVAGFGYGILGYRAPAEVAT